MVELEKPAFDAAEFLANAGLGRGIVQLAPKDAFFAQGDPADFDFLSSERPCKGHSRNRSWERSNHHAGLRR